MTPSNVAKVDSAALAGIEAEHVEIEIDASHSDERTINIVGLPDPSIKESKQRVLAAIRNSGYSVEPIAATINLAPAHLKKEGTFFDFPIALGLLESLGVLPKSRIRDFVVAGELGLTGELRPIRGALSIALFAKKQKKQGVLLPLSNAKEAALVPGINIYGIKHLQQGIEFLLKKSTVRPCDAPKELKQKISAVDFAHIKGQSHLKRALEIAAAGGHNVLMSGPPGSGKTLSAKAFPSILPSLNLEEAIEVTKIYSIAGLLPRQEQLIACRPFRSPHHTISYAGMVGGGSYPRPGEVSLAHHGVLFLDELLEFSRQTLEVLRQPLESGHVTISRAKQHLSYPTQFLLIAAMNPCPCGYLGHPDKVCKDSQLEIKRYQKKISGPLLDRIDLHVTASPVRFKDLANKEDEESSSTIRERVIEARRRQHSRFGKAKTNSMMTTQETNQRVVLNQKCTNLLKEAVDHMGLTARSYHRLLKVALTIATLESSDSVQEHHLLEALSYRQTINNS